MSTLADFGGEVELRDAQGRVFKLAVAGPENGEAARLRQEVEQLKTRLREAEAAVQRLEAEKAAIAEESDGYRKSLQYMLREDFTFTEEEIADLDKNGVEFDSKFFDDLEREMKEIEREAKK